MKTGRTRGRWGGLNSVFISKLIGIPPSTCKRLLTKEKKTLGRYLTTEEIGRFINEQITRNDLSHMRSLHGLF